jgi:AraC-like DNA-binding protein
VGRLDGRLLADMRRPPSLDEVALAVGLTEKRLNAGFQMLFGTTVFESLRNERLEHARIALQSEEMSLKEVSFRGGYNHVTNFVSVFTARYGAPPRQYLDHASQPRGCAGRRYQLKRTPTLRAWLSVPEAISPS